MSLPIHVAVGVILNHHHQVLLAKRAVHQHQGGLWEFPGGKVELGESVCDALLRELKEELGIVVTSSHPLIEVKHSYKDKCVLLDTWVVTAFCGDAKGLEGQPVRWVDIDDLNDYRFPEANRAIVTALTLSQPSS